ncbi:MAG: hypothetical protein AAF597_09870, partial [Bacteroidota bacterium]
MRTSFVERFPDFPQTILVPKALIEQAMATTEDCCGIHFTFGMTDATDPNSAVLLLVPSIPHPQKPYVANPLKRAGYLDNNGELHSLEAIPELSQNFVTYQRACFPGTVTEKAHRANYYGRNTLETIVTPADCSNVLLHLGYKQG